MAGQRSHLAPSYIADNWQEKSAALEEAFRKLPIRREEAATGIPYELLIPGIPSQLLLMIPNARVRIVRTKRGLRSVPASILPTEEGLRRLVVSTKRTVETFDVFRNLPSTR